jgi:hypothetical protein
MMRRVLMDFDVMPSNRPDCGKVSESVPGIYLIDL